MNNYIIELIKVLPNILILIVIISVYLNYKKQINLLINNLTQAKFKEINVFGAKLEFLITLGAELNENTKKVDIPYNNYALLKRIEFIMQNKVSIRALWIEDQEIKILRQIPILKELGINIQVVNSSRAAIECLNKRQDIDLIISDVDRDGNDQEGFIFLKNLVEIYKKDIPTIFYTGAYDSSKGNPPYAFGLACLPFELLNLCLDVMERNIKKDF